MSNESGPLSDAASNQFEGEEDAALHRRLSAAGASWRRDVDERLPQADVFLLRMRQQIAGESANYADSEATAVNATPLSSIPTESPAPSRALSNALRTNTQKGQRSMSAPTDTIPPVTPTPSRRRFAGSIAAAAALLIVALIVVVLARGLTGRQSGQTKQGHHSATATATYTPMPTATPGNNFSGSQGVWTAISPTDPQVIYENTLYGDSLLRSSDGGKTFTKLPLPSTTTIAYPWFYIAVSPLDANHVIASGSGLCQSGTSQASKAPLAMPLSGGPKCAQSFFSADGGQTWSPLSLPFPGEISTVVNQHQFSNLNPTTTTLQAQGSRLFAVEGPSDGNSLFSGPVRLIVSTDGGASWQSADNGLGSAICDFAPTPTGATVYAITTATVCTHYTATQPDLTLMRSDNGGATWASVATLPTVTDLGMFVTTDGALYINMPKSTDVTPHFAFSPDSFIVSRDGGQTFSRSPLAGAPDGDFYDGPGGQLSDGSMLALANYTNSYAQDGQTMTCYAWKAGASSWRQVSPAFGVEISDIVVVSQNGSDVVYFADANGVITSFTV